MTPRVVCVGGTWSFRGHETTTSEWYLPGSPFIALLEAHGFDIAAKYRPFFWSSRVGGLLWQRYRHVDWDAAGCALSYYLDARRPEVGVSRPVQVIIGHSHALQVILYACAAYETTIPVLVSVGSPIRQDMRRVAWEARPRIGKWLHLGSDWSDKMQWAGELFDGSFNIQRKAIWHDTQDRVVVAADLSVLIPGVGHSGLLREAAHFHYWTEMGFFDWIRQALAT